MTAKLRPILFVTFGCLLVLQVWVSIDGARLGSDGRADFRQFYTAGYMIRSGHAAEVYDYDTEKAFQNMVAGPGSSFPFNHLAYEALLYLPFSFLGYRAAYFAYYALNLLLLALSILLLRPYLLELAAYAPWMPYAVFVCFLPVSLTLVLAQDSILLLVLMAAAFVAMNRGHETWSGVLLGLGIFKFQYVIPLALLFLIWRRWRVVSGLSLCSLALAGLSIWMVGLRAARALVQTLSAMSTGLSSDAERMKYGTFPEHMPNLRGLIYAVGQHFSATQGEIALITGVCSVVTIAVVSRMRPSLPLAVTAASLLSYHSLMHDATLLILPVALVLARSIPRREIGSIGVALAVLVLPAVIFCFLGSLYFVMAVPILGLVWAARSDSSDGTLLSDSA